MGHSSSSPTTNSSCTPSTPTPTKKHRNKFKKDVTRCSCLSDSGRKLFYQALDTSTSPKVSVSKQEKPKQNTALRRLSSSSALPPIEQFRKLPQNRVCADCSDASSSWASVTHGVFLCALCVGAHRSLGTDISFTQSTRLDPSYWTPECVKAFVDKGGNVEVNRRLEYYVPPGKKKPAVGIPGDQRREYIRLKYVDKAFTKEVSQQAQARQPGKL